ncbi:MAG: hypothetical protein M3Q07_06365 [Pseudobdellovibrionaceae bacterium]|nr:hypothetical protein [Pseudobdellovibrionaceae bacterium]
MQINYGPLAIIVAVSSLFASVCFADTIRSEVSQNVDLSSQVSSTHEWGLNVSTTVKPTKLISFVALSHPIKLFVSCGANSIGQPSTLFYDESMVGKTFSLAVNIKKLPSDCKPDSIIFSLNNNGVELEVPSSIFSYDLIDRGVNFESIKADRTNKSTQITNILASISEIAGSKVAFYCVVHKYASDPTVPPGALIDFKNRYSALYSSWDEEKNIDCSIQATGVLASRITVCEQAGDNDDSDFCLKYDRYLKIRSWYYSSIDRLREISAELDPQLAALRTEIDKLQIDISADVQSYENLLRVKINTDNQPPLI